MPRRVLCKFFVHGACLKGDHCEFLHDWNAPANNVCTFYQKGICSYGSCCRYDHIKVSRPHFCNGSSSANSLQSASSDHVTITHPSKLTATSEPLSPQEEAETETHNPDKPFCSFAAAGICPCGEKCPHLHRDICSSCGKHCLHPYRPLEREDHITLCCKKENLLDALKYSQDMECSVCLELVLSKPTAFEGKFGLLSECDHPFCITCIRNWRSSSPSFGMDVNSTLRACPICRKLSFFVIPSLIWYSTQEEKLEIVNSYKAKLRSIDCKYFDFGNGTCPFGSSCFYKHAYRDGRLEEVVLRHLGAEDGDTVIAKDMRLSFAFAFSLIVCFYPLLGAEDGDTVIAKDMRLSDFLSSMSIM